MKTVELELLLSVIQVLLAALSIAISLVIWRGEVKRRRDRFRL